MLADSQLVCHVRIKAFQNALSAKDVNKKGSIYIFNLKHIMRVFIDKTVANAKPSIFLHWQIWL